MENGSLMRAFGEWEVIAACLFFMLLLPLIFFIASAQRRPRKPAPAAPRAARQKRPAPQPVPTDSVENGQNEDRSAPPE